MMQHDKSSVWYFAPTLSLSYLFMLLQLEKNSPGLVVAVTVDGKEVWTKG